MYTLSKILILFFTLNIIDIINKLNQEKNILCLEHIKKCISALKWGAYKKQKMLNYNNTYAVDLLNTITATKVILTFYFCS